MKKISIVISIILGVMSLIGGLYAYDCRLAKEVRVSALELRFDQKVIRDDKFYLQQQIWEIEKQYRDKPMPQCVKDMYLKMKYQLQEKEKELDKLRKGGK